MQTRLVLGCGSVGRRLAIDGGAAAHVVTADEHRVETLRANAVAATLGDPTDPAVFASLSVDPETVVVGGDDPARNRTIASLARDTYPDARLLAFVGRGGTDDDVAALRRVVDDVVDPRNSIGEFLLERIGESGLRTRRLSRVLRDVEAPLAVVAHDNPDPDAIASAVGLTHIAERAGTPAEPCYFGDIRHQENRALVNLLEFELAEFDAETADLSRFGSVALVDHSRPGINDQLPADTTVDIVVDHHPPRAPVEARFVDLRAEVGATSTIVTDYLRTLSVDPSPALSTALLFGIQVDTRAFSREVATEDFEAAGYLVERADPALLDRIESPSVSVETFEILSRAIAEREVREDVVVSYVGEIGDRDALAQAADRLLGLDHVRTTLVSGCLDGVVFVSARARGTDLDLGAVLRDAFGQIGSAGGHADMAGAQIPIGSLVEDDENASEVICAVITDRFFETIGVGSNTAARAVYADGEYLGTLDDP